MKAKPFSQLPFYTISLKRWIYCLSGVGKSKKMCLGLGGHLKTGHLWSLQNRPLWMA
jgi:hypothetical protein